MPKVNKRHTGDNSPILVTLSQLKLEMIDTCACGMLLDLPTLMLRPEMMLPFI
jgi:hypothetical protein